MNKIFALEKKDLDKFYIACCWFYDYEQISLLSHSSAYIALVTAIESLIDKSEKKCEKCNQLVFGVNKRFKDFMKKNITFLKHYPVEEKIMYDTRSKLAHGNRLFYRDLETPYLFSSTYDQESNLQGNVEFLTRIAIYNWLQSK